MSSQNMTKGEIIKRARLKKGYTLTGLGKLAGVSQPTLSMIENNNRGLTLEVANRLSQFIDIDIIELMNIDRPIKIHHSSTSVSKDKFAIHEPKLISVDILLDFISAKNDELESLKKHIHVPTAHSMIEAKKATLMDMKKVIVRREL